MPKPIGLGRGLASLIPDNKNNQTDQISKNAQAFWSGVKTNDVDTNIKVSVQSEDKLQNNKNIVQEIPVLNIIANPYQPRHDFEHNALNDLKDSIRVHGILQPIVVVPHKDGYQIIAGERRFRSAQELGLTTVPAIVRDNISQQQQLELSLIENIQRQNLNPIEEAMSYQRLAAEFNLGQEDIAKRVGKSRSKITNSIRLLNLPDKVQDMLRQGKLTEGHAKVILELDMPEKQLALAQKIVRQNLTVRDTSDTVKVAKGVNVKIRTKVNQDPRFRSWEQKLESSLGTRVNIIDKKGQGKIELQYFSNEELMGLVEKLTDLDEF